MDNHGAFGSAFLLKVGDVLFFFGNLVRSILWMRLANCFKVLQRRFGVLRVEKLWSLTLSLRQTGPVAPSSSDSELL